MAVGTGIAYDEGYAARVAERRERIMELVGEAARESGRTAADVCVCAVSKTVDVDAVAAAYAAGYRAFAENRPQELRRKIEAIGAAGGLAGVAWHMIGNLQENKINTVLQCAPALVHSVSSPELAEAVSKRAARDGVRQRVLLEVNVSGEESKSGMSPDEACASFERLAALPGIALCGLMTMAPQGDAAAAHATFAGLAALREELRRGYGELAAGLTELSMGMSEDFPEAIRCGATIVRLGRVAFDPAFPLA